MSNKLLVKYIKMALAESAPLARVPNQLMAPSGTADKGKEDSGKDDDVITDEGDSVNEFSGVGAIAGYTAPLGTSPDKLGRKKNRSK